MQPSTQSSTQPSQCVTQASGRGARSSSAHAASNSNALPGIAYSTSTRRIRSQRVSPPTLRRRLLAYILTVRGEMDIAQPISR